MRCYSEPTDALLSAHDRARYGGSHSARCVARGSLQMRTFEGRHTSARSAVKHRPADVVSQPLVVEHELANRLRELVTLPLTLESPRGIALAL
jgi:hypothetical protein